VRLAETVLLRAPLDVVVAILSSAEDAPLWQHGLVRMEVLSGTAGTPGAKARLHFEERGKRYVMEDELLEHEHDRRWYSRVSGNGMTIHVETLLRDKDGGTELTLTWDGRPDAWLARVPFAFLRRAVRSGMRKDLASLAELAASRAG